MDDYTQVQASYGSCWTSHGTDKPVNKGQYQFVCAVWSPTTTITSLYLCVNIHNLLLNTARTESDSEMEDLTAEMTKVVSEQVTSCDACYVE